MWRVANALDPGGVQQHGVHRRMLLLATIKLARVINVKRRFQLFSIWSAFAGDLLVNPTLSASVSPPISKTTNFAEQVNV